MNIYERINQPTQHEMAKVIYGFVKFCSNKCGGCNAGVRDDAGCIRCIEDMLNRDSLSFISENPYQVTGWTAMDDDNAQYVQASGSFLLDDNPPELDMSAVRDAIIAEICRCGYRFTGGYHQNGKYGVPIINDKYVIHYTQRGWGDIMADALNLPDEDGYAYCKWAWLPPEGEKNICPCAEQNDKK